MCPVCSYYDCVCDDDKNYRIQIRKRVVDIYVGVMVAKHPMNDEWPLLRTACFDALGLKIPNECNDIDRITNYLVKQNFVP